MAAPALVDHPLLGQRRLLGVAQAQQIAEHVGIIGAQQGAGVVGVWARVLEADGRVRQLELAEPKTKAITPPSTAMVSVQPRPETSQPK